MAGKTACGQHIVRVLLAETATREEPASIETVISEVSEGNSAVVAEEIDRLVSASHIPVERMGPEKTGWIFLTNIREGEEWLEAVE